MKIAIQMDPITAVDIDADTTFDLAMCAHERGHELWVFGPEHLSLLDGAVMASAQKIQHLQRIQGDHVSLEPASSTALEEMDVILIRQDPPYDMAYISAAQILERLTDKVLVLNDPRSIRDAPEKLYVTDFKDLTPPTLITRDKMAMDAFRASHGDVIIKPLYGNGGAGVFKIAKDDGNYNALIEMFTDGSNEPIVVQKFLPAVTKGDKRIILIDGDPIGVINRVPKKGETRSNMHVGGKAEPTTMSTRDREICERIGPALSERGLVLLGIDVIGDYLTEINVTSPTGVQEVRNFGGADISAIFWDWAENKLAN